MSKMKEITKTPYKGQKIPEHLAGYTTVNNTYIWDLQQKVNRYKEALKFYADEDNYTFDWCKEEGSVSQVSLDEGKLAREALGE